ncbi:microtubule assembly factor abnormal spindle [Choristoneura fumiferana]|uniref:microtubule assembly factor abnormal spindle n=1 Tax=Choristoneura fumiferana TaxID=7141 RepID=UPI003D1558FF
MYFEIDNTPEHIRKSRRAENARKETPKEECPRLILAPFSRPPQVLFDNVLIGSSCERQLEVFNPAKCVQQVTLSKPLPHGLEIQLPGDWLVLEPETCYCLTMSWTPMQPIALRETIHFANEKRGRYDVIVVLKSVMNIKGKNQKGKVTKVSPGKNKRKPLNTSPVTIYKKKTEIIYNTTTVKKAAQVIQPNQFKKLKSYNKENISGIYEHSMDSRQTQCPFDTPVDIYFNTSEIFSSMRRPPEILQQTYDKSTNMTFTNELSVPHNVLQPSNKQLSPGGDIFDNLTFTPLKSAPIKKEKLEHGPKIILSMNSDCDDDSLDNKENMESGPQSIIYVTSSQPTNKWMSVNPALQSQNPFFEKPIVRDQKIPNTSSPKDLHSPNFSINTDFSRISDLSFCPPRFSTERKNFPKNNTHDLIDDFEAKPNSDTYTKESPNAAYDYQMYFMKDQNTGRCKQSLFREYNMQKKEFDKIQLHPQKFETNVWRNEPRTIVRPQSPPRSVTPPLQSIPEESNHNSETQILDKTDKQMHTFTVDQTFDTTRDRNSSLSRQTWSKRDVRADPTLWKVPIVQSAKQSRARWNVKKSDVTNTSRPSNVTFECNKSINQNLSLNLIGNVYSQSLTVDPFLSTTYFYDEEAVAKFEKEFKRWLNYILTPPADLDCNLEQKIDVGKAWLENRNKEVPLAPTREKVSSAYHNNHRLESLRRSAKALLLSPEICQVFQKLNAQIEKKLIFIRPDRNLHLDVGLQKVIMELLLCYNPLWLRIGLEALYCLVLPLRSNSDIDGLTTFIIQRMFKNPFIKNKHSKSSAPNMLLPAYMEAIKKFTLKKFFMLIFFLDQAKQKKLISHDPCLFRRNAICKESREIVIRFTRELIAGIGDITKHLRPLGYVVSHKQTYLDEYIYAVQNIAVDIRDGVRLTKVMEIILMKNGLLNQLRTPAISRLQKIHNVQVALNALKEAKFVIVGDITATDIADGHREKTMSLLWQLIHVFRAPLFETAANVIQTWWKKKYKVIVEKREEEEKLRLKLENAARTIQCWWQRIQYNRYVEKQMQLYTRSTLIIQTYCRRWLCRTRLLKMKTSVRKIEEWYISMKETRKAKDDLQKLRLERMALLTKSAIEIQRNFRRWQCVTKYQKTLKSIVLMQSLVRRFLARKSYLKLQKSVTFVQQTYRGKLLMKTEMKKLSLQKHSAIVIQKQYKMLKQYRLYRNLKLAVLTIERFYEALIKMRRDRKQYLLLKQSTITIQTLIRGRQARTDYVKQKEAIINLQRRIRARQLMMKDRSQFVKLKNAVCILQNRYRSYLIAKKTKEVYIAKRQSAIVIQRHLRAYLLGKTQRSDYVRMRNAAIILQRQYKSLIAMRQERTAFLKLKTCAIQIQGYYRALLSMRSCKESYQKHRAATIFIQRKYRAQTQMKFEKSQYIKLRSSCIKIQNYYRAIIAGRQQKNQFQKQKKAAIKIQNWFRNCNKCKTIQQQYQKTRQACVTIQRIYRTYIISKKQRMEYLRIRTATIRIQTYFRSYIEMKTVREQYIKLKTSTATIQRFYRGHLETKNRREEYMRARYAAILIQNAYRRYKESKRIRREFCALKQSVICLQRQYRSILAMRKAQTDYEKLKYSVLVIQQRYRCLIEMRKQRTAYLNFKAAAICIQKHIRRYLEQSRYATYRKHVICIQRLWRSQLLMRNMHSKFVQLKTSTIAIQRFYRGHLETKKRREEYLRVRNGAKLIQNFYRTYKYTKMIRNEYNDLRKSAICIQRRYRSILDMRKTRDEYQKLKTSVLVLQQRYRAQVEMRKQRTAYLRLKSTAIYVQKNIRRYLVQSRYLNYRKCVVYVQRFWRGQLLTRLVHSEYIQKKTLIVKLQAVARGYLVRKKVEAKRESMIKDKEEQRRHWAASKIQALFRGHSVRVNAAMYNHRVVELRRRWREGALLSTQDTLEERNEEAMDVLNNFSDMESVIKAFRSLELLTEVFPMMYNETAPDVVRRVYVYMSFMNRSISSVEVLKSAASVLANLTRYRLTGPKIYAREYISPILKYMWRFSNSEIQLFLILCTYLWLFSKYDAVREDLAEFLHLPENHKMMVTIKSNVDRVRRMTQNANKNKPITPCKNLNSTFSHNSVLLPALEPDYGIARADQQRYFVDTQQAIHCLFRTYKL